MSLARSTAPQLFGAQLDDRNSFPENGSPRKRSGGCWWCDAKIRTEQNLALHPYPEKRYIGSMVYITFARGRCGTTQNAVGICDAKMRCDKMRCKKALRCGNSMRCKGREEGGARQEKKPRFENSSFEIRVADFERRECLGSRIEIREPVRKKVRQRNVRNEARSRSTQN